MKVKVNDEIKEARPGDPSSRSRARRHAGVQAGPEGLASSSRSARWAALATPRISRASGISREPPGDARNSLVGRAEPAPQTGLFFVEDEEVEEKPRDRGPGEEDLAGRGEVPARRSGRARRRTSRSASRGTSCGRRIAWEAPRALACRGPQVRAGRGLDAERPTEHQKNPAETPQPGRPAVRPLPTASAARAQGPPP